MLFTQEVRAGFRTFIGDDFSMPWDQRPGLCERHFGLSEQYWG